MKPREMSVLVFGLLSTTILAQSTPPPITDNRTESASAEVLPDDVSNIATNNLSNSQSDSQAKTTTTLAESIDDKFSKSLPKLTFPYRKSTQQYSFASNEQSTNSRDKGMQMVYIAVNSFIQTISKPLPHEYLFSDDTLVDVNRWLQSLRDNVSVQRQLASFESNYALCCCILLLIVFLFTLFGLLYCVYCSCRVLCKCCCRRKKIDDKKTPRTDGRWDACKRRSLTSVLAVLVICAIFSMSCAYITNEYTHLGAQQLPGALTRTVDDLRVYRDTTDKQIEHLLVDDYEIFSGTLLAATDQIAAVVIEELKIRTGASALDDLLYISKNATEISETLQTVVDDFATAETQSVTLTNELKRLVQTTNQQLADCQVGSRPEAEKLCKQAAEIVNQFTEALPEQLTDLSSLQGVSEELGVVRAFQVSDALAQAVNHFQQLQSQLTDKVAVKTNDVSNSLSSLGVRLSREQQQVHNILMNVDLSVAYATIHNQTNDFENVERLRALTIGVLCIWLLSVVNMIVFLLGGNLYWLACHPAQNPLQRSDISDFGSRIMNSRTLRNQWSGTSTGWLAEDNNELNVTDLIWQCHNKHTLYTMLQLDDTYNITSLSQQYYDQIRSELNSELDSIVSAASDDSLTSLLPADAELRLRDLANLQVDTVPLKVVQQLDMALSNLSFSARIDVWSGELSKVNQSLSTTQRLQLNALLTAVQEFDTNYAQPLRLNLERMRSNVLLVNDRLKVLTSNVPLWTERLTHAQQVLASNLTSELRVIGSQVLHWLGSYPQTYAQHLTTQLHSTTGACVPLAQIANATQHAVCVDTLNPLNAYWFSSIVSVLLLLVALLLGVSLRPLYTNTEPYTGIDYMADGENSTPRHRRVSAFMTDTYEHTYRRLNGTQPKRVHGQAGTPIGYAAWRAQQQSGGNVGGVQFDGILTGPAPAYTSSQSAYVWR